MDRPDPFIGYSWILRTIIFVVVPAFTVFQYMRLRRALHIFQLEGYKRHRFLAWTRANPDRARFMSVSEAKKPLVMTGRAWRILVAATVACVLLVLGASAAAHLIGGAPFDIITWAVVTALLFWRVDLLLMLGDVLVSPVQKLINGRFLGAAQRRLKDVSPTVVGVTGSFGKTSTKFAIQGLIGPSAQVLATPGSFNTPLGVCRTINEQMTPEHRFFVVEMGAYGVGEIAELCHFVHHEIGVLTAVGPAHLERFGSMDAIKRGKYEIVTELPDDGIAVMNVDDPIVRELANSTTRVRVIRYGIEADGGPEITAEDIATTREGTSLTINDRATGESIQAGTRLLGRHAVGHILAAVAVAKAVGRPLAELPDAIARLTPVEHRLQIIEGAGGVTVIDDAYNSNPKGAAAALEVLEAMPADKKVVVTPGIIELGELQAPENERFGEHAARVADVLIVVARTNRDAIVSGAKKGGGKAEVLTVDSLAQATEKLQGILGPGAVVLFENDLPDQYEG